MIKNALILLQQQTKTAVEEVLKRIETQQTERMKLEFVMRDMKKCMKEELQRREAIEADVQLLQSHVNIVKKEGQKKASIEAMPNELVQYVLILSRNVEREIRIRKEMEQQVSQLRRDVTILLDKIAGMSK
jgi:glutamate synthase domain-containing protein 1